MRGAGEIQQRCERLQALSDRRVVQVVLGWRFGSPRDIIPAMRGEKAQAENLGEFGTKALRVRQWRREQFYRLGFSNSDARTLARSGADLTATRELIAKGCDPATAYRIVR